MKRFTGTNTQLADRVGEPLANKVTARTLCLTDFCRIGLFGSFGCAKVALEIALCWGHTRGRFTLADVYSYAQPSACTCFCVYRVGIGVPPRCFSFSLVRRRLTHAPAFTLLTLWDICHYKRALDADHARSRIYCSLVRGCLEESRLLTSLPVLMIYETIFFFFSFSLFLLSACVGWCGLFSLEAGELHTEFFISFSEWLKEIYCSRVPTV